MLSNNRNRQNVSSSHKTPTSCANSGWGRSCYPKEYNKRDGEAMLLKYDKKLSGRIQVCDSTQTQQHSLYPYTPAAGCVQSVPFLKYLGIFLVWNLHY